jgi:RNA polymerase sigma factor (sigma-70 family)
VQEAYIQAFNVFVESRGADARAWLLTIVLSAAHNWIQKRGNDSNVIPLEEPIRLAPTDEPPPESSHDERNPQLHVALSRLPVEFREVLALHEIEGWSYKQLASALNVSAATVMSRLSQARRRLGQSATPQINT